MDLPLHNNYSINLQKNIGKQCKRQSMPLNNNYSISLQKNKGMQCKRWSIRGHTYSHARAHASGAGGAHIPISCTASLQGSGCFGETNSTKLKSFFCLLLKDIKATAKKRRKTHFYTLGVTIQGEKQYFPVKDLQGRREARLLRRQSIWRTTVSIVQHFWLRCLVWTLSQWLSSPQLSFKKVLLNLDCKPCSLLIMIYLCQRWREVFIINPFTVMSLENDQ